MSAFISNKQTKNQSLVYLGDTQQSTEG